MLARACYTNTPASRGAEVDVLYQHLSSLAALAAFPASELPLDLAVAVAAAAEAAREHIGTMLPRYCGLGLGESSKSPPCAAARIRPVSRACVSMKGEQRRFCCDR